MLNKFKWMKIYFSPFIPPKIKFYFGKIAIGTPYFYPRKWVKHPEKEGYLKPVPKTIGFDFVDLGWKTKWEKTDYRFEYAPIWSFVFFGYQFAVFFVSEFNDELWTAWLYYKNHTDQTKNVSERIEECRNNFSLTYTQYGSDGTNEIIDYYNLILKEKYLIT